MIMMMRMIIRGFECGVMLVVRDGVGVEVGRVVWLVGSRGSFSGSCRHVKSFTLFEWSWMAVLRGGRYTNGGFEAAYLAKKTTRIAENVDQDGISKNEAFLRPYNRTRSKSNLF